MQYFFSVRELKVKVGFSGFTRHFPLRNYFACHGFYPEIEGNNPPEPHEENKNNEH